MSFRVALSSVAIGLILQAPSWAQEATIHVLAQQPQVDVSRFMTGACIEDVNHEIYGGIYSQMIFGESFQEPAPSPPIVGFKTYGGSWAVKDGELHAGAGEGPKLISEHSQLTAGDVSVEMKFPDDKPGLAGLILKIAEPGIGADRFIGYEVSLDPKRQVMLLGRHRQNWEPIQETPCKIPVGQWVSLAVHLTETSLSITVDGRPTFTFEDREHPLKSGTVGLRTWQRDARYRRLTIKEETNQAELAFQSPESSANEGVSGMWRAATQGLVTGKLKIERDRPFHGTQSQRITLATSAADGASFGVENRGLNRWGMNFVAGKPYEGVLWLRAKQPTEVFAALEHTDGKTVYAESRIAVEGDDWKRYDFSLTPSASDARGRLAIKLKKPGSVVVGYAFLQPGPWGRFKGLPVRRDIAEGLINHGVTVLRLGGLMANAPEYRWKKMIGPRDRRQPYKGFWYPHSSNGWGVIDFLDFCDAAGFLAVPDLNVDESPQDLADFVEYVNGPPESVWGKRRAESGRVQPYRLRYLELGNEEAVDEAYWSKFKPIAEAVWAKDPAIILIVGDFEYKNPISDPFKIEGAARIKTLAAHKKILDLAKANGREVWFDVHIWNHNPRDALGLISALKSFGDALEKLSPGASFKLCVLEENATNHAMRRGVAHAETINGLMRQGDRVKIVCAANCLQPDCQNDNGWDQGLLFLNPSEVWAQPSLYVTQIISQQRRPRLVKTECSSPGDALDAVALTGVNGKGLTLQVVNRSANRVSTRIQIEGTKPWMKAKITQISGSLDDRNTALDPEQVVPWSRDWKPATSPNYPTSATYTFAPHSVVLFSFD